MMFQSWLITVHAIIVMGNSYGLKEFKDVSFSFYSSFIYSYSFFLPLFIPLSLFSFLPQDNPVQFT